MDEELNEMEVAMLMTDAEYKATSEDQKVLKKLIVHQFPLLEGRKTIRVVWTEWVAHENKLWVGLLVSPVQDE